MTIDAEPTTFVHAPAFWFQGWPGLHIFMSAWETKPCPECGHIVKGVHDGSIPPLWLVDINHKTERLHTLTML